MEMFERDEEGRVIEPWVFGDFGRCLEKRRRLNPMGENCYLSRYGWVYREEDSIVAAQRIWRERAYSPPGTLYKKRGYMYRKSLDQFTDRQRETEGNGTPNS